MGFTTVPEALRVASRSGRSAVEQIRGADCSQPVESVPAALPGTAAASAADQFTQMWSAAWSVWCTSADSHASNLGTAADTYTVGDQDARRALPDEHVTGPR